MSTLLQSLYLAPVRGKAPLSGLVGVRGGPQPELIAEQVAVRQAGRLEKDGIDYIFFRRFSDERSSQVAAYVVDNSDERFDRQAIADLHRKVWLNGTAPLLYVGWPTQVDVLACAAGPGFWNERTECSEYVPTDSIKVATDISKACDEEKVQRFSAFRLSNGTFWEDPQNSEWANAEKGAHHRLIQAVIAADRELNGATDLLMRQLLLLTILAKYLEDRKVFPGGWFGQFQIGATSFLEVLLKGSPVNVRAMLGALGEKFNGDIFDLPPGFDRGLTREKLNTFVELLEARTINKQAYLWKQYGFVYIPVEVLSHLYQHFAQRGKGAVFTPPFVASLMLDYTLPYERITGDERILDPTCGSGIFLVGAFRRLVHVWQSKNEWKRPGVSDLKKILQRSIFGAELQEEAAHLAAFNLALAVCDALQPKVIWDHLRFDKIVGKNILVGDLFENLDAVQALGQKEGFTTVIGNPPFLSKLTEAAKRTRSSEQKKIPVPDGQMAYRIAEVGMSLLGKGGRMCLLQNAGFLYNANARTFQNEFFCNYQVDAILDFVSIRKLFEGADPKTVALIAIKNLPAENHQILHLTFRRTLSVQERIGFELDHYDRHHVSQETAENVSWVWKANLLGGGRLFHLGQRMKKQKSFKDYFTDCKWDYGEGFIVANAGQREPAPWLTGKPYLPTENLKVNGIQGELGVVTETDFRSTYTETRYSGPIIMFRANEVLPCAYRSEGFLAFRAKIIGVHADLKHERQLKEFYTSFLENRDSLRAFLYLFSTQLLIGKSTAVLKRDIDVLPAPISGNGLGLSWWEKHLCNDIVRHLAEFVRRGQNSKLLRQTVAVKELDQYAQVFIRLLGSIYKNLRPAKSGISNGLAYQAFCFGEKSDLDWPDDWSEHLKEVVFVQHQEALQTARVVRFYEQNTIVIIKPDRLRHWIKSTAIRDADETLIDLQEQGF
jgi:hypothetical protein